MMLLMLLMLLLLLLFKRDGCEATSRFRGFEAVMLHSGTSDCSLKAVEAEALEWISVAAVSGKSLVKADVQKTHASGLLEAAAGGGGPSGDNSDSLSSSRSGSMAARRTRRQLIIGISANLDAETRQQALAAGMDAFLPKASRLSCMPYMSENFLICVNVFFWLLCLCAMLIAIRP